jgi:hypothetical protein
MPDDDPSSSLEDPQDMSQKLGAAISASSAAALRSMPLILPVAASPASRSALGTCFKSRMNRRKSKTGSMPN